MPVSRPVMALAFVAALLAPSLTVAQQAPRLLLVPADIDRDGHVSDAERASSLAETTAEITPIAAPASQRPRKRPAANNVRPGPLEMARRIVPASEFEVALEDRFNREVERRRND